MSIGIFSDMQSSVQAAKKISSAAKSTNEKITISSEDKTSKKSSAVNTIKKLAPMVIPLAAIPITAIITYKLSNKNIQGLNTQIKSLSEQIIKLQAENAEKAQIIAEKSKVITENLAKETAKNKKANAQIWSALIAAAGVTGSYKAGKLSKEDKSDIKEKLSERVDGIDKKSSEALENSRLTTPQNPLGKKYTENYFGIELLKNTDSINKNKIKYENAIESVKSAAPKYLYSAPEVTSMPDKDAVLWSVTSEFAPIKEGGLGSVPVELQNNITKLGINIPTFIPMYQIKGIASFKQIGKEYTYTYNGNEFKLEKAASFKVDAYQDGKPKTETVEIFVNNSKDKNGNNKQLIFIKNDNYFNGTIYQTTEKSEEPEKFAFFSKSVYELAKSKFDVKSVKDLVIENENTFESIKKPNAFILNDWQASPIAALARYKSPLENAYGQLSDEATQKMSNMTIATIGHNAMYQGATHINNNDAQRRSSTENILNTLFDNFAFDIVSNAKTNASEQDLSDSGLKNLDNSLLINYNDKSANHTNLLNMGICLSNYFHPVSQNYANELTSGEHHDLSGELEWALTRKKEAGSLVGIINGNDFNNLSIEAKAPQMKKLTGLDLNIYTKSTDLNDVMKARLANKINFYNNYIMPLSLKNDETNHDEDVDKIRELSSRLEFVDPTGKTKLPVLSDEELAKTPIITSIGRLVSQKGISLMCDSIKMLMDNWEKDFPNKPKPIFYLAGSDGEGGAQRKFIETLKSKGLSEEDSNRVVFAHGFVPVAAMNASSDYFLLPSIFEPCGLTQGESFAVSTPVIASAVGGIVDTVNRNDKTNGILTDKSKPLSKEGLYEAIKEGLDIYYNNPEKYKSMVKDALAEDFSWIQKGKQGPIFEYLEKIGFDLTKLPEVA